jgi:hypothetical protein
MGFQEDRWEAMKDSTGTDELNLQVKQGEQIRDKLDETAGRTAKGQTGKS